jgi:hypothetical protein
MQNVVYGVSMKNKKCEFLGPPIKGGWVCRLGYGGGRTWEGQCKLCLKKGINKKEIVRSIAPHLKDAWKLNLMNEIPSVKTEEENKKGLGDLVEKIAQPIAKKIDKLLGTNIRNCGGCKRRKNFLNRLLTLD